MSRLVCATHGHCFDGLVSAAFLTELVTAADAPSSIDYVACGYGPTQSRLPLDGELNAVLDFRYEASDELTYYFDHHATAFRTEAEREHFATRARSSRDRFLWDPTAVSCAGLIARHAETALGLDWSRHEELIKWADRIDGAQFETAEEATSRAEPILRLAAVVERFGDSDFIGEAVPILRAEGPGGLAQARFVKDLYRNLAPKFREYEKRVRDRGSVEGRVAFIDLSDRPVNVIAKFAQYREYPQALYSVILALVGGGWKISAGFNPWNGAPLDADIGSICARYGGGGHAVVGAVSYAHNKAEQAREVALAIAKELQGS